jgi:hypothetical protein
MANLGKEFYQKLINIGNSAGINPADLLLVMSLESGLKTTAMNPAGGAVGLIQFMPFVLKGLGFGGTSKDFASLDAVNQLDYVEKYVKNKVSLNGGPFKSAAQYYVANFWPAALSLPGVRQEISSTPIVEKDPKTKKYPGVSLRYEKLAYSVNSGLDVDKDGIISYGDLQKILASTSQKSLYQSALNKLKSLGDYSPEIKDIEVSTKPRFFQKKKDKSTGESFKQKIMDVSKKTIDYISNLLKGASDRAEMHTITVYNENLSDRLQFCKIASNHLDDNGVYNKIHTDKNNINIQIVCNNPDELAKSINDISLLFNKSSDKKIKTFLTKNRCTLLPELDNRTANINNRLFILNKLARG